MITTADLKSQSKADLAGLAKGLGVSGWNLMRKDQLIAAVARAAKKKAATKKVDSKKVDSKKVDSKKVDSKKLKVKPKKATKPVVKQTEKASKKVVVTAKTKQVTNKVSSTAKSSAKSSKQASPKVAPKVNEPTKSKLVKPKPAKVAPVKPPKPPIPKKIEPPTNPKALKRIREFQLQQESSKDIAFRPTMIQPPGANEPIWEKEPTKDRIALLVRDPYWLHVSWDVTRRAMERAKAALAEQWHTAIPKLRCMKFENNGTTNTAETIIKDITIHGGLRNWYIDIDGKGGSYRVAVGYLSATGRFHAIAESNVVQPPIAGANDAVDNHWSDMGGDVEHIYAMSGGYDEEQETTELKEMLEDRLHRPIGAAGLSQYGAGADAPYRRRGGFHFEMDVELVLFGATVPDGHLTLNGEPVTLRQDGTFVMRLPFPDRRQVLPALATSRDGSQQRTIVIAVERNTKIMEPFSKEMDVEGI